VVIYTHTDTHTHKDTHTYIYIYIVFSACTLTTFEYAISLKTKYRDECDFATNYTYADYIWQIFSFGEDG
jgi:hypothetical protein